MMFLTRTVMMTPRLVLRERGRGEASWRGWVHLQTLSPAESENCSGIYYQWQENLLRGFLVPNNLIHSNNLIQLKLK